MIRLPGHIIISIRHIMGTLVSKPIIIITIE